MYNPFEVIFSFPRFYLTLYLFGREFHLDLGWFRSDNNTDWKFGPELILLEKMTSGGGGGFVAYWSQLKFTASSSELLISLGAVKYD